MHYANKLFPLFRPSSFWCFCFCFFSGCCCCQTVLNAVWLNHKFPLPDRISRVPLLMFFQPPHPERHTSELWTETARGSIRNEIKMFVYEIAGNLLVLLLFPRSHFMVLLKYQGIFQVHPLKFNQQVEKYWGFIVK